MTRKEYLESMGKPKAIPDHIEERDHPVFLNLNEYLIVRRKCDEYEQNTNITDQLNPIDYELFDRNFEKCLDQIKYHEEDGPASDVDKAIEMMEAVGWKWAHCLTGKELHTPTREEFIEAIKYCYERALESGKARGGCSTGGISVDTDILDHMVTVTFGNIDVYGYDKED